MAYPTTPTNEVDPISRIEGHLGVAVTVSGGKITEAYAHGNLWRGFENFLLGRDPNDAITFVQRICGVCPVPHGMTSTYAVDTVLGYSKGHITFAEGTAPADTFGVPKKAVLIRNLVLGAEFLMSSITHFYHLAAPSYIQGPAIPPWTPFFANSYYHVLMRNPGGTAAAPQTLNGFTSNLWSAVIGSYVRALRARRLTFEAGALFAGRMPMTSCYIGGGVTNAGTEDLTAKANKFKEVLSDVGRFIVQEYVPVVLALGALYPSFDNLANATLTNGVSLPAGSPVGAGATLWAAAGGVGTPDATNTRYGAGLKRMLSWGAFPNIDAAGTLSLPGGIGGDATALGALTAFTVTNKQGVYNKFLTGGTNAVPANLTEDIQNSRYSIASQDTTAYTGTAAYPGAVSRTKPNRAAGYTYMKAPRWGGKSFEVGPFARLVVAGLYPTDETTTLAGGALAPYFAKYLKLGALDPKMVNADIAVALVRQGLATLTYGGVTYGVDTAAGQVPLDAAVSQGTINTVWTAACASATDGTIGGLITAWITNLKGGFSILDRVRARGLESLYLVQELIGEVDKTGATLTFGALKPSGANCWISDLLANTGGANDTAGSTWRSGVIPTTEIQGWGGTEAPRGALMHQCTINGGKITKYQCIVPTTWNGSPQTTTGGLNRGAIEQACIDVPFAATSDTRAYGRGKAGSVTSTGGVEVLRVAQSFDPCIACAVH